jgi:hypothetical protein
MKPEDRSKLHSFISDISGLKARNPEQKKFADWKKDVEKKLEDVYGKGSDQVSRFRRIRFFDFEKGGRSKEAPLSEGERNEYMRALDEARRLLQHFV